MNRSKILKYILNLSSEGISILIDKIKNTTIKYEKRSFKNIIHTIIIKYKNSKKNYRKKYIKNEINLICLNNIHLNNSRTRKNVKKLFKNDKKDVLYDLDNDPVFKILEMIKVLVFTVFNILISTLLSKYERELVKKVLLAKVEAEIVYESMQQIKPKKVIMVGMSYEIRRYFLSYWIKKNKNIKSIMYINRPFINNEDNIITDEIILSNCWSYEIYKELNAKLISDYISYTHNINYYGIKKRTSENSSCRKNRVAFYMSGAYMREDIKFRNRYFKKKELEGEISLIKLIKKYALKYENLKIVIFPHPSVENEETSKNRYCDLLKLKNVNLKPEGKESEDLYDNFEIGISRGSNVIFERLEAGHKGLFVFPVNALEIYKKSSIANIILDSRNIDLDSIENLRKMNIKNFYNMISI